MQKIWYATSICYVCMCLKRIASVGGMNIWVYLRSHFTVALLKGVSLLGSGFLWGLNDSGVGGLCVLFCACVYVKSHAYAPDNQSSCVSDLDV